METLPQLHTIWDFSDPQGSEQRFRELLPRAIEAEDLGYRIEVLSQIARAEGLQGRPDDAHRTLDQAEALLSDELGRARIRVLLERGRTWNGRPVPYHPDREAIREKARPCFLDAWELGCATGEDALAIDAAHMLGIIEPPDDALAWNHKAIEHAEAATTERARGWLGPLYNNTGWTYFERGELDQALNLFSKGVEFRATTGGKPLRIAKWTIVRTLREMGEYEAALDKAMELLVEWSEVGEPSGYTNEEIGECLLAMDREEEATPYFAAAYQILSQDQWLSDNEPERLSRLSRLAAL
jgi:tetratricopeptide (TPR) repeat protein